MRNNMLKSFVCSLMMGSIVLPVCHAANAPTNAQEKMDVDCGPGLEEVYPVQDWNRCMGDTAMNLTQWQRWWKYVRQQPTVVMNWVDGLKIKIYPNNEVFRSLYVNGMYDPNILVVAKSLLKDGDTIIDVGSNCGYLTLPLCKDVGNNGKIIAIEPSTRDYKRLVENVELNGIGNVVKTIQMAVGDRIGQKTMMIANEERSNVNTLGDKFAFQGIEKQSTEDVNVTTIDNIVSSENLSRVDVIKLDVEGSEIRCLEGAKLTIQNFKPALIIRINKDAMVYNQKQIDKKLDEKGKEDVEFERQHQISQFEKILQEYGYQIFDIVWEPFSLLKVKDLSEVKSTVVVCLPDGQEAPQLPQPPRKSAIEKVEAFFK